MLSNGQKGFCAVWELVLFNVHLFSFKLYFISSFGNFIPSVLIVFTNYKSLLIHFLFSTQPTLFFPIKVNLCHRLLTYNFSYLQDILEERWHRNCESDHTMTGQAWDPYCKRDPTPACSPEIYYRTKYD